MPQDPCQIPPGRQWAVDTCDAEIPGPQWDNFVRTGRFHAGIQKGLDDTAHCWVNVDVWVKRSFSREKITGARIPGFFPWGWYKVCRTAETQPPDPVETLRVIERIGAPIIGRGPVAGGEFSTATIPTPGECVVPVPDVDVWIPWPRQAWSQLTIGGQLVNVPAGAFGRVCRRIPGSQHPLFSTGLGIQFIDPAQLSELGRQYVSERHGSFVGMPGSWFCGLFDEEGRGYEICAQWYTRDFAASHMQCLSPLRYAPGVEVNWRWRRGGASPAPYIGDGFDVFDVEMSRAGSGAWANSWIALRQYARTDEGVALASLAPEWPLGTDQFNGPDPGTFG